MAPSPSAPVISNSQRPDEPSLDIGYEEPKESIPTYDTEEDMLAAAQEKLDNAKVEEEEEYEEVTIPSESELKAMTKAAILEQGNMLDFVLDTKDTKAVMITSFLTQVDEFIASLQESGEFVSAEDDEGENDNPNIQDGGYF
jgi:monomeric isocitrate dehydrogenase